MGRGKSLAAALAGLLGIALCGAAWGQGNEGGADLKGKGRPFRAGAEGRPAPKEGMPGLRPMMPGMDVPIVRDEMQRHMEAMRNLLAGERDLAQQVAAEARALQEKNTPPADLEKALSDKFGAQAEAAAAKAADEMARHFEALTKIYKDNRDETVKQLAQSILRRMANREPGPRLGGAGAEKGDRPFPKGKGLPPKGKDDMPENF